MDSKASIRTRLLAQRDSLPTEQVARESKQICDNLKAFLSLDKPRSILLYAPIRNEVDPFYLLAWLRENHITVCLPSIQSDSIVPLVYDPNEPLIRGSFGINEPSHRLIHPTPCEIIVVPCIAVDKSHYRLGYGKGFYDRYLNSNSISIGLAYSFQVLESFPHEPHDQPLSSIVTHNEVLQ